MGEDITLNVRLSPANAAALVEMLKDRAGTEQGFATAPTETVSSILTALDAATSQKASDLSAFVAVADEARQALGQAVESLAQAHAAFEISLAKHEEPEAFAASAAIRVGETNLQRAQAVYDTASGRAVEAKAESAETNRRIAYARSQRTHDEALIALRRYEPLAFEMLKLFSTLSAHADLALADVEAADKARISPNAAKAVHHLKTVLEEQRRGHAEAVTRHVLKALAELEPAE